MVSRGGEKGRGGGGEGQAVGLHTIIGGGAESKKLREEVNRKKTFSFGHCPNDGGGGLPMPEFFGPLFRSAFLVNKKSLFPQKCQCIELLTVF